MLFILLERLDIIFPPFSLCCLCGVQVDLCWSLSFHVSRTNTFIKLVWLLFSLTTEFIPIVYLHCWYSELFQIISTSHIFFSSYHFWIENFWFYFHQPFLLFRIIYFIFNLSLFNIKPIPCICNIKTSRAKQYLHLYPKQYVNFRTLYLRLSSLRLTSIHLHYISSSLAFQCFRSLML